MGIKWKWSLGENFWYRGRWRLWNIETTNVEYKRWRIDGRSCDQNNIDFWFAKWLTSLWVIIVEVKDLGCRD